MTFRILTLVVSVGALAIAGCGDAGTGQGRGSVDLDSLGTADPFDQLAYNSGYSAAQQFVSQYDSTFSYALFSEGFEAGMSGDSARIAYALGLRAGLELRADTISNINADVFLAGLREGLDGADSRLDETQLEAAYGVVQDSLELRQLRGERMSSFATLREQASDPEAAEFLSEAQANEAQADSFLAAVAQRPGVQQTSGGLLYTVDSPGAGEPIRAQSVMVTYEGRFLDGEVFDASTEPVEFNLQQVVPGFRRTLMDMRPGETRTIYLPPLLGYGVFGRPGPDGGGIPPNTALVFEMTLVGPAPQQRPQGLPPGMQLGN